MIPHMVYFSQQLEQIKKLEESIKPHYLYTLTDASIDLDVRWAFFLSAPAHFKYHALYKLSFQSLPYSYYTILLTNATIKVEELAKFFKDAELIALKEEILSKNLGSMVVQLFYK